MPHLLKSIFLLNFLSTFFTKRPMTNTTTAGSWEKRWHPLRQAWIVYAAHRNKRPWQGEGKSFNDKDAPEYDEHCYLCPGNKRVSGKRNPDYKGTFVFENDHPVVGPDRPDINHTEKTGLYRKAEAHGNAYVICYDPRHNITLSEADRSTVEEVIFAWRDLSRKVKEKPDQKGLIIFENKGEMVGVSNPHPHCQAYALDFTPPDIEQELQACGHYRQSTGKNLFHELIVEEQQFQSRIIDENNYALSFLPFFARFAYEAYIFPKTRHQDMTSLSDVECKALAEVYQGLIRRYDMNYQMRFPYVMSIMQAPLDDQTYPDYHMRLQFLPPLRQPGLKKYLAGPELGAGAFMADTMPEEKAKELRAVDLNKYQPL